MSQDPTGRFVWHDLMSTDVEASRTFYTDLFGWRAEAMQGAHGSYYRLHAGEVPIGGIVPIEGARDSGAPTHWIGYVDVMDALAVTARSEALGGETCVPVMDFPGVGKVGVFVDPQGGVISPIQDEGEQPRRSLPAVPAPGTFCRDDLHSTDPAASMAYYGETFGWTFHEVDLGEGNLYHVIQAGDHEVGGIMESPSGHHAWLSFVAVSDVEQVHARATALGAPTYAGPGEIPQMGCFAVMGDPTGGVFAVLQPPA